MASVLLVEDDLDASEAVSRYLTKAGHRVDSVISGRDALARLLAKDPDIILLDVFLPELDGVSFLDVIRSYARWAKLPVVVLTAHPTGDHIARMQDLGVQRVFCKANYELADLLATVNELARPALAH